MLHSLYSQICFPPVNALASLRSSSQTTKSASLPDSMEPISFSRPISRAGISVAERMACSLECQIRLPCAYNHRDSSRSLRVCRPRASPLRHTETRPVHRGVYCPSGIPQQRSASETRQMRPGNSERHAHCARMDVLAVADQLRNHVFTLAARANGAGLAVVDAGHGVEQVRQMGRARVKDRAGFFVGAVAVRDGDCAELRHLLSKLDRARQLRRHIRNTE